MQQLTYILPAIQLALFIAFAYNFVKALLLLTNKIK